MRIQIEVTEWDDNRQTYINKMGRQMSLDLNNKDYKEVVEHISKLI